LSQVIQRHFITLCWRKLTYYFSTLVLVFVAFVYWIQNPIWTVSLRSTRISFRILSSLFLYNFHLLRKWSRWRLLFWSKFASLVFYFNRKSSSSWRVARTLTHTYTVSFNLIWVTSFIISAYYIMLALSFLLLNQIQLLASWKSFGISMYIWQL
jgi:hypothetical protein